MPIVKPTLREKLKRVSPKVPCTIHIGERPAFIGMPRELLKSLTEDELNLKTNIGIHTLFNDGRRENEIFCEEERE